MLEHRNSAPTAPKRVVVMGSRGVIGKSLVERLRSDDIEVRAVPASEIDLLSDGAADRLAQLLDPDDALVVLSALTPDKGRDVATLMKNLKMAQAVCDALERSPCGHVIYFSSDAVYPFVSGLVTEESAAAPQDLYGIMHRTREIMFQHTVGDAALAILRCTLVLATADTHNSYGPNRFRRQAKADSKIGLGGEGEETRDHLFVDDVVGIVVRVLRHRSEGTVNVASGNSVSFLEAAKLVAAQFDDDVEISFSDRTAPITHRHFDIAALYKAFPDIAFTPLADAIAQVHREAFPDAS